MPSRRDYLAASGAALGSLLAGCSQFRGSTTDVDVTSAEHRHSAFYVNVDAPAVHAFDGQAVFVTLDATAASTPPEPGGVSLVADGTTYDGRTSIVPSPASPSFFDGERPYSANRGTGWLLFELPCPLDADDAHVEFSDGTQPLPDSVLAALAEPAPSSDLVDFEHPDAVVAGEPTTVSATVRHAGGPGPVRLAFTQWVGTPRPERVTESIPAGETETVSHTFAGQTDPPDVEQARLAVTGPGLESRVRVPFRRS